MSSLIDDPLFFYAISYVLFFVLMWFVGRKPILGWLDGEIGKIREEIEHARRLRSEAEEFLNDAKIKQAAALSEAETIVKHAKEEAGRLRSQTEAELKYILAKHEQNALDRIHYAEEAALTEVRLATVDMAVDMVRKTLAEHINDSNAAKMVDDSIADVSRLSISKPKAA